MFVLTTLITNSCKKEAPDNFQGFSNNCYYSSTSATPSSSSAEIPPSVEYSLTKKGQTLLPVFDKLNEWGSMHLND